MIKHLFKLAWNRKRSNYLIMLEIFFSYLVLFSVVILTIYYLDNYRKPLGFDYKNVWTIHIGSQGADDDKTRENQKIVFKQLLNGLAELSEIESFCGISMPPFGNGDSWGGYTNVKSGKQYPLHFNNATDDLNKVLNLKIISGRWFGKEDDGAAYIPVVINKKAAEGIFGDGDPIGKDIWNPKGRKNLKAEENLQREERVVGIIDDFRISIEDTGCGLSRNVLENLLTPFFSTKENGQGIGLTLIQEILDMHGFKFSLDSSQNGNTEFKIIF